VISYLLAGSAGLLLEKKLLPRDQSPGCAGFFASSSAFWRFVASALSAASFLISPNVALCAAAAFLSNLSWISFIFFAVSF